MDFSLNLAEHHTPTAKSDITLFIYYFQGRKSYNSKKC